MKVSLLFILLCCYAFQRCSLSFSFLIFSFVVRPLIVPQKLKPDAYSTKPKTKCGFRVGDQIRQWEEGKAIVFDDSYEHEVWNETDEARVLLLVDIWHPDVRAEEREKTKQMFEFAKGQGWLKDQQT